jgi:hypothetical protein
MDVVLADALGPRTARAVAEVGNPTPVNPQV